MRIVMVICLGLVVATSASAADHFFIAQCGDQPAHIGVTKERDISLFNVGYRIRYAKLVGAVATRLANDRCSFYYDPGRSDRRLEKRAWNGFTYSNTAGFTHVNCDRSASLTIYTDEEKWYQALYAQHTDLSDPNFVSDRSCLRLELSRR